jgi:hypothetical protein
MDSPVTIGVGVCRRWRLPWSTWRRRRARSSWARSSRRRPHSSWRPAPSGYRQRCASGINLMRWSRSCSRRSRDQIAARRLRILTILSQRRKKVLNLKNAVFKVSNKTNWDIKKIQRREKCSCRSFKPELRSRYLYLRLRGAGAETEVFTIPSPQHCRIVKGLRKYMLLGRKFSMGIFISALKFYSFLSLSSISEIIPPYHKVYFIWIQVRLTKKVSRIGTGSS